MKSFKELLIEKSTFKVGEMINFHNDMKKLTMGKITKITGSKVKITDNNGIKFSRDIKDIYEA